MELTTTERGARKLLKHGCIYLFLKKWNNWNNKWNKFMGV